MVYADGHRWELDGGSLSAAAAAYTARRSQDGLGDRSAQIVELAHVVREGIRADDAAGKIGISPHMATEYLLRLEKAGRLKKVARGLYNCVCCVVSTPSAGTEPIANTHNTHHPTYAREAESQDWTPAQLSEEHQRLLRSVTGDDAQDDD